MPKPTTLDAYLAAAPDMLQEDLRTIRSKIRRHLPDADETMGSSGFPVYTDGDGKWLAGFAWRKKGAMLYIMSSGVLDRYADRLGKLRSGKSCIAWRGNDSLSMDELRRLADEMLGEVATRQA